MATHPIRIVVTDDLVRSRLTVFFRLLLAIPHLVWLALWSVAAVLAALASWFATLALARSPLPLHRFLAAYVRYTTHVRAYLFLAANPFPRFTGEAGSYPIDVEIDGPQRQSRLVTLLRIVLAIPALILASGLLSLGVNLGERGRGAYGYSVSAGALVTVAFLGWFACVVRGRMPPGFRNLLAYGLRYSAQLDGYLFLLTSRYPDADPGLPVERPQPPPVRLTVRDDLRRSRLTVFFRLLLALPHLVWLALWTVAAWLAAIANWFATLAGGRSPRRLHAFLAAYVSYSAHVSGFLFLVANPFPGFTGERGSYPLELVVRDPEPQRRLVTAFRLVLAIPAFVVGSVVGYLLVIVGFLGWFACLVRGRMPEGLRNLGAYAMRYGAQANAYALLLTDRYPYSGPEPEGRAHSAAPV